MNELLMVFAAIMEKADRSDPLLAAVLELLCFPLHNDEKSGLDLVCAVDLLRLPKEGCEVSGEATREIEKWSASDSMICDFSLHRDWLDELDPNVLRLPIRSGCGADCFIILLRTESLLSNMADVDEESRSMLRWTAAQQCSTFYNG